MSSAVKPARHRSLAAILARALGVSLVVTAIGGALLWGYLRRYEEEASGGAKVLLLVLVKNIEPGAALGQDAIAERLVPQAYVEPRAVRASDRARVVGLRTTAVLQPQNLLHWTDLAVQSDERRDVSGLVQAGMRAVVVRADGRASQLVRPGDRVDVLGTFSQPDKEEHRSAVVLLQNILVLARGADTGSGIRTSDSGGVDLALSVNVSSAQLLAVASDKGKISVAIRNPDDLRVQDGLADVSSTVLVEAEKRTVVARGRSGPNRLEAGGVR